ncbi:hypothetical protein FHETE_3544 [Fusarium heterosporum]|uniref:Uncharacterized protein n=1 Tax=Fusarium heterosporum TaxID=42747 RepID=A0A8H5TIW5_FUSHE|nr:hypothetical protein FHETE_3544 [Fusarium heterosporum]
MFRLPPTTVTITSRELNDAERRSRYRKHLLSRQRINRRRERQIPSEYEAENIRNLLNTPLAMPAAESVGSKSQSGIEGEEDAESHLPSRDNETNTYINLSDIDNDHDTSHTTQVLELHRLISRPRPDSDHDNFLGIEEGIASSSLPIRTRFNNTGDQGSEQDEAEHNLERHISTTVFDRSPYEPEDELTNDRPLNSTELVNFSRESEMMASTGIEELNVMTPRRHLPVYSDHLPSEEQPQTPRQLPEARHQSRFDRAYTAPVRGRRQMGDGIGDEPNTVRRTRAGYNTSPVGLRTPGFQGLYGGSENADDG